MKRFAAPESLDLDQNCLDGRGAQRRVVIIHDLDGDFVGAGLHVRPGIRSCSLGVIGARGCEGWLARGSGHNVSRPQDVEEQVSLTRHVGLVQFIHQVEVQDTGFHPEVAAG